LTVAASLSTAGFLAAAVGFALGPRFSRAARALAAVAALLFLPGIDSPSTWPLLALAGGAALLGSPLPSVLAAAGSYRLLLQPELSSVSAAPAFMALAAAVAAGALSSTLRARGEDGGTASDLAAAAGGALVLVLVSADGGALLRWGFALGSGPERVEMRGAGLVLGLALLASLGGTLLLAAHRLAPSVAGARGLGLQLLLPGAALSLLGAAHVAWQGVRRGTAALGEEADLLVALVLVAGALATALASAFRTPSESPSSATLGAERETALAVGLAWLAVAAVGGDCWRTEGTYLCPRAAAAAAAGLFGLAALAPGALAVTRRLLLAAGLVLPVLFPGVLG
jgi:hypothetical protein